MSERLCYEAPKDILTRSDKENNLFTCEIIYVVQMQFRVLSFSSINKKGFFSFFFKHQFLIFNHKYTGFEWPVVLLMLIWGYHCNQ